MVHGQRKVLDVPVEQPQNGLDAPADLFRSDPGQCCYKIASRWAVNAPVFATHGIWISRYATPGLGQGIGGLTDFSFPVASPPAERLAESKKVYASDYEDAIDELIEELVAAERKMTIEW
jgi:hypothetical protein